MFLNILSGCHASSILLLFPGCQTGRSQAPESHSPEDTHTHTKSPASSACLLCYGNPVTSIWRVSNDVIIQRGPGNTGKQDGGNCTVRDGGRERGPQYAFDKERTEERYLCDFRKECSKRLQPAVVPAGA